MNINDKYEQMLLEKLNFKWQIELSQYSSIKTQLSSRIFTGEKTNYQWSLKLTKTRTDEMYYNNGYRYDHNRFNTDYKIEVSLCLHSHPQRDIYAIFEITSIHGTQNARTGSNAIVFNNKVSTSPSYCLFDSLNSTHNLQINIDLKVQIAMKSGENDAIADHRVTKQPMKILKDFEGLLEDNTHSDFVISVGDGQIKCHKNILSCRSPYFKSLFESGLKESVENSIKIIDFTETAIRAMINFFYTAELKEMNVDSMLQLLKASDFYQVSDLKTVCENFLVDLIDTSNACDMLLCADASNAEKLKKRAIAFISQNLSSINNSCYELIEIERPHLLSELLLVKGASKN